MEKSAPIRVCATSQATACVVQDLLVLIVTNSHVLQMQLLRRVLIVVFVTERLENVHVMIQTYILVMDVNTPNVQMIVPIMERVTHRQVFVTARHVTHVNLHLKVMIAPFKHARMAVMVMAIV
jgi:hypothetical protein